MLARRGRIEEARAILAPLAEPNKDDPIPAMVRQIVGQECEDLPALRPLAITLFAGAIKDNDDQLMYYNNPVQRLVEMYRRAGRLDDARRELLAFARKAGNVGNTPGVSAYYRINDRTEVASVLLKIGFPADAAKLNDETLADRETLALARDFYGDDSFITALRRGLDQSLQALDRDSLAATLRAQLREDGPAIDLLLLVQPRELERAAVSSLLEAAIRSSVATGGLEEVRSSLAKITEKQPRDIPSRVALVLAVIAGGSSEAIRPAVAGLVKLVEESPLEPLAPGERANARQRAEASRYLGLWLVARETARRPDLRDLGRPLAERALEAARRLADPAWSLAMLREIGRDALDRDDRDATEAITSRMLDQILATPSAAKPTSDGKNAVPVATLDRFEQAAKLARLAARQGMAAASLRAVREPLRGGPPVVPLTVRPSNGMVIRNPADAAKDQAVDKAVEEKLSALEADWDAAHAPAVAVYETLREAVIPEGRPSEIFAYPRPIAAGSDNQPRNVAALLVRWGDPRRPRGRPPPEGRGPAEDRDRRGRRLVDPGAA